MSSMAIYGPTKISHSPFVDHSQNLFLDLDLSRGETLIRQSPILLFEHPDQTNSISSLHHVLTDIAYEGRSPPSWVLAKSLR
jgi:hypothetical protein